MCALVTGVQTCALPILADDHSHPRPAELVDAKSPLGDCCQAGDCCACMHHCFAALVGSTLGNVSVLYRQTAEPFLSLHASDALTNLFRPPIGSVSMHASSEKSCVGKESVGTCINWW